MKTFFAGLLAFGMIASTGLVAASSAQAANTVHWNRVTVSGNEGG